MSEMFECTEHSQVGRANAETLLAPLDGNIQIFFLENIFKQRFSFHNYQSLSNDIENISDLEKSVTVGRAGHISNSHVLQLCNSKSFLAFYSCILLADMISVKHCNNYK